jgi:hypothetical protein
MKLNQDEAKVLREVVAAIPQVADVIASFPPQHKVGALEAAEGGYVRAMLESGFAEPDAKKWAAAVMRRLRNRVAEHDAANSAKTASAPRDESSPTAPQPLPQLDDEREAKAPQTFQEPQPPPMPREFADEYAEPPPTRPRGGLATFDKQILTGLPNVDDSALEKYAALTGRWRGALLASIDKRGGGLWLATALSLGIAAGLVVSAMENATFQPYFVGLFVSIGIWLLLVSLPQPPKSK